MKQTKLWMTTAVLLLCSITKVSGEIILSEESGPLGASQQSSNGSKRYYYASPLQTLDRATSTLVLTFLEGYSETTQMNDKNGFPFVNMTEFYLYDGDGNEIVLNASNFSTNAQEPTEGAIGNICDKNFNTFFHSMWSAGASDYHNITVTLPEGVELKEFSFGYYTRYMDKWTCHGVPKKIKVQAGYETVADGTCGDNLTWRLTAGGELTISGSGPMYDYNNDAPWHDYRASIKKVTIGEGVTTIGCTAFANCENLVSTNMPDGVARIGWEAFFNTNISSVYIPKSVLEIWNAPFGDCDNLVSIIVDAENPVYDSRSGCNAIIETSENRLISGCASTIIPDGVVNIAQFAFIGCDNLTSITFPESLNIIEYRAFWTCNGLTSIVIPKRVWHIDQQAFGYCYNLGTISVDSGNLDYDSRDNCNAIIDSHTNTIIRGTANTIIPESVKAIGDFAFSGCLPMKNYNIPEGVTSIGNYAFCQCNNLVSINIPQSVNTIGEYAFYNCYNLTSVALPQSVAEIKNYTFAYCSKLASISFPDELKVIGVAAFDYCSSIKTVAMPNSVERVGMSAFRYCRNLESVLISENIDSINHSTFVACDNLRNVVIPNNVTYIGQAAFGLCLSMETLVIGKSVETIDGNAFNQCLALSQIDSYATTPPLVGNRAFYKVNATTCRLNVPVGSKAVYQAADVWKDFSLISEKEELTSIEQLEASNTSVWPTNIYDINGSLVRENACSADGLTGGVYIINGRKVLIND